MSLIQYVGIAIAVIVIAVILFIIKTNKRDVDKKPYLFSLISLFLIISNWIVYLFALYLTKSYLIIPGIIGNYIFIPLWFIVSIISLGAAYKESKNNKKFALVISGLALVNALVGMVLWGIGQM